MPQFTFRATDRLGNAVEGTISASDSDGAEVQVKQMGYTPIRVQPAAGQTPEPTLPLPPQPTTEGRRQKAEGSLLSPQSSVLSPDGASPTPSPSRTQPPDLTQPITEI